YDADEVLDLVVVVLGQPCEQHLDGRPSGQRTVDQIAAMVQPGQGHRHDEQAGAGGHECDRVGGGGRTVLEHAAGDVLLIGVDVVLGHQEHLIQQVGRFDFFARGEGGQGVVLGGDDDGDLAV